MFLKYAQKLNISLFISYRQQHPEQATTNQNYSNEFLGLDFKEICVYLQRIEHDTFPLNSFQNESYYISWSYNPEKLQLTDLINNLEDIKKQAFHNSQEIEN